MRVYRKFQVKPRYFYCIACPEGSASPDAEALGHAHMKAAGHEVRVAAGTEVILRPAAEVVTCDA